MHRKKTKADLKIIDKIEAVRRKNNRLWMDILRLAISACEAEARAILRDINANDAKIGKLLGQLSK